MSANVVLRLFASIEGEEAFVNERFIFSKAATRRQCFAKLLGIVHMSVVLKEGILCLYCWVDLERFEFLRRGLSCLAADKP